jgi:hypothetical protein
MQLDLVAVVTEQWLALRPVPQVTYFNCKLGLVPPVEFLVMLVPPLAQSSQGQSPRSPRQQVSCPVEYDMLDAPPLSQPFMKPEQKPLPSSW